MIIISELPNTKKDKNPAWSNCLARDFNSFKEWNSRSILF